MHAANKLLMKKLTQNKTMRKLTLLFTIHKTMKKLYHTISPTILLGLLTIYLLPPSFKVALAGTSVNATESIVRVNPFTPKAYLIRYWNNKISNDLPKPWFLLNKASPLTPTQVATFSKLLADQNSLSTDQLSAFCNSADLLCISNLLASSEKHQRNVNFNKYKDENFTNYGTGKLWGADSFKTYDFPVDSFRTYSRNSMGHTDKFNNYALDENVADQRFNTYGARAGGGAGGFTNYNEQTNVPNLRFTSYSDTGHYRTQTFKDYNHESNHGDQVFNNYGKSGEGEDNDFSNYGNSSNTMSSGFSSYGQKGDGANDQFTSYGFDGNIPENNFRAYGDGGKAPMETFTSYRNQSNTGDDSFQSYGKGSNAAQVNFRNYGQSFNGGSDNFKGYGKNAQGQTVGFKVYGVNSSFKDYAKTGISFAKYRNISSEVLSLLGESGKVVMTNKWVEPGRFFREKMLKTGLIMPMPDIRDKMPKRSFLPRTIVEKLPFSTGEISQLKGFFHAKDNSTMTKMLMDTLSECERPPSPGETKQCVRSAEDMIDFATTVLGRNIAVRTTENTKGSNDNIMIGTVKAINDGKVTKSVSCHQSLFPSLLYYCHSVPMVRVYEADLLDSKLKTTINHGVAICHIDTSTWSSNHGAFNALGSGPGKIEVCHWIFENDMTWTIAD